jgi:probable HAF family extracellular repeat protein
MKLAKDFPFVLDARRQSAAFCAAMKSPRHATFLWLLVCAISASVSGATFQGLGLGAEPNSYDSNASAVSADGSAVTGGYSVINGGSHAYRWTACTGMIRLDPPSNGISNAYDISGNGSVVVGFGTGSDAFRWTEPTGMTGLGLINAVATAVSDDGTLILGYGRLNGQFSPIQAWSKTGNGPVAPFNFPDYLAIYAVSADNSIVVGGGGPAYRWTSSTGAVQLADLDPDSQTSIAFDISADGTVIVGTSVAATGEVHLVTWTGVNNTLTDLGILASRDGVGASADATNANGSVIVGEAVTTVGNQNTAYAFIWDAAHGIRKLQDVLTNDYGLGSQLSGWQLTDATGISDDGNVIAGDGVYTDSNLNSYNEAWLVTLYSAATLTCGTSRVYYNGAAQNVSLPLSGAPGIECRSNDGSGSGTYTFVFGFTNPISGVDSASPTCGTVVSRGVDPNNPNFYLVQLNGANCNQQYVTVSLSGVHGLSSQRRRFVQTSSSASLTAGLLIGDVNGSGRVDAADVSFVRQQTLQPITTFNFRADVNGSGRIDAADVSLVRQQTLTSLP